MVLHDLIFKNGFVIDGTGAPWFKADVGIKDGRIVQVGRLPSSTADRVINATGLVVCPGFIDMHTHSDSTFLRFPKCESRIYQGITTDVACNCGTSASGPLVGIALERARFPDGIKPWRTLGEYMERFKEVGVSVNAVFLVGFGTVRIGVIGYENMAPTKDELDQMKALVAQTMEEGAFGMSAGLQYPPQNYAETSEVIECAKVVSECGGFYTTHTRRRGYEWGDRPLPEYLDNFVVPWVDTKAEAIREAIRIGEEASLPVHIAHFKATGKVNWGKMKAYLAMIDDARRRGIDVTIDTCYPPYTARGGIFQHQLPAWIDAQAEAAGGLKELLKDPVMKAQVRRELIIHMEGHQREEGWEDELILSVDSEEDKDLIGKTVAEAAKMRNREPIDFAISVLAEGKGINGISFVIGEEDLMAVTKYPFSMICSDSSATNTTVKRGSHPRVYGTFPRFLRIYVREQGVLRWEEAIHKITGLPASRLGLWDRGFIRPGNWADIAVFDPIKIRDNATYEDPVQYSEGILYLTVNGVLTIDEGRHTGITAGKPLVHRSPNLV